MQWKDELQQLTAPGGSTEPSTSPAAGEPPLGREAELAELRDRLGAPGARVLVCGPPGVGKTRLARQIAGEWAARPDAKVGWVDASAATDTSTAILEMAAALGLDIGGRTSKELRAALSNALREHSDDLIVLDGCDAGSQAHQLAASLVEEAPKTRFLLTTHTCRDIDGCSTLQVEPLDLDASVRLMRARARGPVVELHTGAARRSLERLAAAVDRLPLALEWLGSRLEVWRPEELCDHLDQTLEAIVAAGVEGPSRSIELIWRALPAEVRATLEALSIFAGAFSAAAAGAVAQSGDQTGDQTGDAVATLEPLLQRHLLRRVPQAGDARFKLLEVMSVRASRSLEHPDHRERAVRLRRRFVDYYVAFAQRQRDGLRDATAHRARRRLLSERHNLERAFALARHTRPADAARLAIALGKLGEYLPTDFLAPKLEFAVEATEACDAPELRADALLTLAISDFDEDQTLALRRCEDALASLASLDSLDSADAPALQREVRLYLIRMGAGVVPDEELLQRCDDLDRRLEGADEPRFEGLVALARGDIEDRLGRWDAARRHFDEALASLRKHAEPGIQADAHDSLGVLEATQGRLDAAAFHFREAHRLHEAASQRRSAALALEHLATLAYERGQYDEAIARQREALEMHRRLGNHRFAGSALVSLACMEFAVGAHEPAKEACRRALMICKETHQRLYLGQAHGCLGSILLVEGALEEADEHLIRALEFSREHGSGPFECRFLAFVSALRALQGRVEEARRALEQTRRLADELGLPPLAAVIEYVEAIVELARARRLSRHGSAGEARARLASVPDLPGPDDSSVAADQLTLAKLLRAQRQELRAAIDTEPAADVLHIGSNGHWFEWAGRHVDLSRRRALSRILYELARSRIDRPGEPLEVFDLVEAGWADETLTPDAARNRVYTAVRRLRKMGLRHVLVTRADGYLLDEDTPLRLDS